jgi:lipopolysaccharide heptosyltransferase II
LKVLILKPSSLGDVVQALPVLRLIKLHHPHSEIYWWIDANLAPLLAGDPDLAGLIPFDRRRWSVPWRWDELWQSVRNLRAHHFDWVIDLQSLFRSGAMAWLANGAFTIGLDDPREGARGFHDVSVPRRSYHTHAVDWYLDVLPRLGVPADRAFTWLPERPQVAEALAVRWRPEPGRWIALQPGARWTNKRWPIEHFVEVVGQLSAERADVRFAILGGEADQELGEALLRAAPDRCRDLTGRTSLPEMIEWTRRCELLVTNDTGPMHVAAALGRPVVALFGPTEPRRTGPYRQVDGILQHRLPCVPCMKASCSYARPLECLRAIVPEIVLARVRQLLDRPAPGLSLNRISFARVD